MGVSFGGNNFLGFFWGIVVEKAKSFCKREWGKVSLEMKIGYKQVPRGGGYLSHTLSPIIYRFPYYNG
jgi:hypothetical protein